MNEGRILILLCLGCFIIFALTNCTASVSWYPVDHIDHKQTWTDKDAREIRAKGR